MEYDPEFPTEDIEEEIDLGNIPLPAVTKRKKSKKQSKLESIPLPNANNVPELEVTCEQQLLSKTPPPPEPDSTPHKEPDSSWIQHGAAAPLKFNFSTKQSHIKISEDDGTVFDNMEVKIPEPPKSTSKWVSKRSKPMTLPTGIIQKSADSIIEPKASTELFLPPKMSEADVTIDSLILNPYVTPQKLRCAQMIAQPLVANPTVAQQQRIVIPEIDDMNQNEKNTEPVLDCEMTEELPSEKLEEDKVKERSKSIEVVNKSSSDKNDKSSKRDKSRSRDRRSRSKRKNRSRSRDRRRSEDRSHVRRSRSKDRRRRSRSNVSPSQRRSRSRKERSKDRNRRKSKSKDRDRREKRRDKTPEKKRERSKERKSEKKRDRTPDRRRNMSVDKKNRERSPEKKRKRSSEKYNKSHTKNLKSSEKKHDKSPVEKDEDKPAAYKTSDIVELNNNKDPDDVTSSGVIINDSLNIDKEDATVSSTTPIESTDVHINAT